MGYDDWECLSCYCDNNYNDSTSQKAATCLKCIDKITEGCQGIQRVMRAIFESHQYCGFCQRCGRQDRYVFEVSTCKKHPLAGEEEQKEEEEEEVEEMEEEKVEEEMEEEASEHIEKWEQVGTLKQHPKNQTLEMILWAKTARPNVASECKVQDENGEFVALEYFYDRRNFLVARVPGKSEIWAVEWS